MEQFIEYKGLKVEAEKNFGTIRQKTNVSFIFRGQNLTEKPMLVRTVPTCGCTTTEKGERTVGPMEHFTVEGTYGAGSNTGSFRKRIHLYFGENTSSEDSKVTLTLTGTTI